MVYGLNVFPELRNRKNIKLKTYLDQWMSVYTRMNYGFKVKSFSRL